MPTKQVPSSPGTQIKSCSLLPPGPYTFRLFNIQLIWGENEAEPSHVKILFPSPYEAVAGEQFVDFFSETTDDDSSSVNNSSITSPFTSPTRSTPSTVVSTRSGGVKDSPAVLAPGAVWRKAGSSKTGTCMTLEAGNPLNPTVSVTMAKQNQPRVKSIPSLQLTWRGDEPIDKLHISLQASMSALSFSVQGGSSTKLKKKSSSKSTSTITEYTTGNFAVSLEHMCKAALLDVNGRDNEVTVARPLLKYGSPMYYIDPQTLQREPVTVRCSLELLSKD